MTRKSPSKTSPREIDPRNAEVKKFDAVLAENPPRIQWQKNKHGIYKAVSVRDPHKDRDPRGSVRTYEPLPPDTCEPMTPHAVDPVLMAAARREI